MNINQKNKSWFNKQRHISNKNSNIGKISRLIYYRLIIPMRREAGDPKFIAYGVLIGIIVGLTPTVGVQMPLCFICWWLSKKLFNFHFSLIISIAWSWLSNPASMIPLYFLYYQTGQLILNLGNGNNVGFDKFNQLFANADLSGMEGAFNFLLFLWDQIGISIWIGCIPYAIIFSLIGYYMSIAIIKRYKSRKKRKAIRDKL